MSDITRLRVTPLPFLFFALMLSFQTWAQSDRTYRPNWAIKVNPLAIIYYTPGVELGVEQMISNNSSLHLGLSYLDDFGFHPNKNFSGYKILGEYRYYQPFANRHPNTFLSGQFNFKQTFANGRIYLDRANGNYQRLSQVDITNTSLKFMATYGKIVPLNSWLSLDFSVATGVKRLAVTSDNIPADAGFGLIPDETFLDPRINALGTEWYPLLRFQFRMNVELFRQE